jgi:16S rRNA (adenine1518-N6/adenine1519-N6)-dimethyltransferase
VAVEIGPGRGALTRHLLPRTSQLHAIEVDPALVSFLHEKFAGESKLRIHHGDVLTTDLSQWGPAVIAGNLPYYITSPIIDKFLRLGPDFPVAVFLIQEEVAARLSAAPGTRDYGFLSVSVQLICEVDFLCAVPAAAFIPPPKVDSAGVRLRRRPGISTSPHLMRFVGRCFAHKRKTLRNNLLPFYGSAADTLPEAGMRAEQIAPERFVELYGVLAGPNATAL